MKDMKFSDEQVNKLFTESVFAKKKDFDTADYMEATVEAPKIDESKIFKEELFENIDKLIHIASKEPEKCKKLLELFKNESTHSVDSTGVITVAMCLLKEVVSARGTAKKQI